MDSATEYWRKCNSCKKPIPFRTKFWVCNVSTCNRKRTGLVFCTVACWDAHVPMMNHRDSWALEKMSPSRAEWETELRSQSADEPARKEAEMENENAGAGGESGGQVLVVASKLKNYIREKSGMNTSAAVMEVLSQKIRGLCDLAIENAKREGRKTVMDRDFQSP